MIVAKAASPLETTQLLALNAAGDDAGSAIAIGVLLVLVVSHVDLLRGVSDELNRIASFVGDIATIAALAQQGVDCLDLIPACNFENVLENCAIRIFCKLTLLGGYLWKVCRRSLGSALVEELNADSVESQLPV